MICVADCDIEHQDIRDAVNGFSSCNSLIPLASSAPSLRCRLSLYAALKNLRESGARDFVVSTRCFLESVSEKSDYERRWYSTYKRWIEQVVYICRSRSGILAPAIHASDGASCVGRQHLYRG